RIIKKSGETIWIEEFGESIKKGKTVEFVGGIMIDLTQKKTAEKAMSDKEYAEASKRAKSEFLANMNYEIRTQLNGIIDFTDLLMNTNLEQVQKHYMTTINNSANSLMDIINDVLDFSKIEAGKLEIEIEKIDLLQLTNQIIDLIKYQATTKKIDLKINIAKNTLQFIYSEVIRLKQILINLLSNGIKFTESGKVILNICTIKEINKTESIIQFSVLDTGIGIKKINQTKIFNAFSQEDGSITRKFGGTGMGLTISNKLLGLLDSKLELESKHKVGSNFYFNLKIKTLKKTLKENINEHDFKSTEIIALQKINKFGQENYRILIVEDNKINMLLSKTLVKQIIPNASIFEAENGRKAIEKFELIKPDLVLMDVQMPQMNGYEATIQIRKLKIAEHIPIIALAAGIIVGERDKCLQSGMNDYLSKPIIKQELEKTISKWISI
ncbi:MAG: response regulator, partial [Flavobacterium sp.]|nr:response regulator [Flavobacterium sp.]